MKHKPHPRGAVKQKPIFTAHYFDHPVPHFNTNPLIRALRPLPSHLELPALLTKLPVYEEEERQAEREMKIARLLQLQRQFFVAFPRIVELMEMLHNMICEGYITRAPFSEEDQARRQDIYERQENKEYFQQDDNEGASEFTAALIGIPGIGKSKALQRVSAPYRRVIYHPELNIYQIPALLIEMPYKGVSVNTLAHAIIRAIDKMFPQGNYYEAYLSGRENAEVLFMDAVQLMQTHYVGVLLVDETQNKEYRDQGSRKPGKPVRGQTPLTTLLITATNESEIPMIMCGTPELRDILGARMSMLRRMVGRGMRTWKPLSLPTTGPDGEEQMGEFDVFLNLLWDYQWTRTKFELTRQMRNTFYYYTQGVSDIIVKLFHDVQLRAIRNGEDEVVDEALIHAVAQDELGALTELTRAMREMDYDRSGQAADLAAYLRIDPHEMSFERQQVQGSIDDVEEAEMDPDDDLLDDTPPEVFADAEREPVEVPTGAKAKQPRKPRVKQDPKAPAAPIIEPVDDINDAFDS